MFCFGYFSTVFRLKWKLVLLPTPCRYTCIKYLNLPKQVIFAPAFLRLFFFFCSHVFRKECFLPAAVNKTLFLQDLQNDDILVSASRLWGRHLEKNGENLII